MRRAASDLAHAEITNAWIDLRLAQHSLLRRMPRQVEANEKAWTEAEGSAPTHQSVFACHRLPPSATLACIMRQRSLAGRANLAVLAMVLLLPSWALAARADKTKDKARAARKACLAGDPVQGVALLAELFIDSGDPNHIYNQARCYEQNHRYEDAISRYREFLKLSPGISERDRANVQKEIETCQGLLPAPAPVVQVAPVAPPAPAPTPAPATPVVDVVSASPVSQPAPAPKSEGQGLRIAGMASGAVGLASIGMGIYFYTRASSLSDRITNSDDPKPSDYRSGKSAVTMQWVFYGVGAAALATGSILYYLGWSKGESSQTAVAPVIGPSMAGIAAKGAF
jgi:tetratricopeptide (TPR) repeat protein